MSIPMHVEGLRGLLGRDVLLLSWELGKKGGRRRWKQLTADAMNAPGYLRKLGEGNIGVALGRVSGGLCSLDIDADEEAEEFLAMNSGIGDTLRSKGRRGCNFWWRVNSPYPPLTVLKRDGKSWGEWRADGAQTIIYGRHPDGNDYQILNRVPPLTIDLIQIQWPEGILPLLRGGTLENDTEQTEPTDTESTEPTEQPEFPEQPELTEAHTRGNGTTGVAGKFFSIDEAIRISIPDQVNNNHKCLFTLARAIKALEQTENRKFASSEMKVAFRKWHGKALPFLQARLSEDDYWFEFLAGYENAEHPLGVNIVTLAWERIQGRDSPEIAKQFATAEVRLLVTLCQELQRMCGDKAFFLASRTLQNLLGHDTHATAARWLKGLCRSGILKVEEQGGAKSRRATRFRYLHPL